MMTPAGYIHGEAAGTIIVRFWTLVEIDRLPGLHLPGAEIFTK